MSDRFATQIGIDGNVKRDVIADLLRAINADQLQSEWGSAPLEIKNEEELLSFRNNSGILWFCREEQSWGQFKELEEFLERHGIPFDRRHEPRYEHDGELAMFRPGSTGTRNCAVDASGMLIVPIEEIQKIRDMLRRRPNTAGVKQALRALNTLCEDAEIESLPRLEIVD